MSDYILKATNINKAFAGVKALKGVDLEIKRGEIHCLAGENGSGKSTLIKVFSGIFPMDSGSFELDDTKYLKISPLEAISKGLQVIYQDFSVFQNLSVMENIALHTAISDNNILVNWKRFKKIAEEAVNKISFKVDLNAKAGELSILGRQLVAICCALTTNAKIIIMDEPTTALTDVEIEALFRVIKDLKENGIAILFVSHKLNEVFEISERFTILRNGENVITGNTSGLNNDEFIYHMTGRKIKKTPFLFDEQQQINVKPILEVKNLSLKNNYEKISFSLRKGEIIGITGLLGCGRSEVALSLFGMIKYDSGEIIINGKKVKINSVEDAVKYKIGYLPEDRLKEGLFLPQSIGRNIVITILKDIASRFGIIKTSLMKTKINEWVKRLPIYTSNPDNPVRTLSGGNQQRVVLAKWLATDLDVLILNGPTVGVDIGSKYEIYEILSGLAKEGLGIIIISDDLPEIMLNCNQVLIMSEGKIVDKVNPRTITENDLYNKITSDR